MKMLTMASRYTMTETSEVMATLVVKRPPSARPTGKGRQYAVQPMANTAKGLMVLR